MPPEKIRILHLIKSLGRGGAEKLIPETAALHDKERFEFFCLYFFHTAQNIVDELEHMGIKVSLIPSSNLALFFQISKVRKFVIENKIDIIHSHLPWAGILGRLVGRKLGIPIVYTEHNTWDRYNKFSYWGNRLTFKMQDVAIAVSNEVALTMRLNSILNPLKTQARLKVKTIVNGVNTDNFQEDKGLGKKIRQEELIPENAFVIGQVAVFRSQKRLWLWVDVAMKILEKEPHVHFLLVGYGQWQEKIIAQIKASGKQENFHLVGVQTQVIPYLSALDLYMSTSEFEGLPIAMLEAMSCKLPIIATRAGGVGEVITDGEEGYLCDVENHSELVGFALNIIRNKANYSTFSTAARLRVINNFSMIKMVAELEKIYEKVIIKKSEPLDHP
jgi:glycosyltransferase involved in cell wall biosynthesis